MMNMLLSAILLISMGMIGLGVGIFVWTKEWYERTKPPTYRIGSYIEGKILLISLGVLFILLGIDILFTEVIF